MPITLTGYFRCINEHNKLQIALDDVATLKEKAKDLEGKSPIFTWTGNDNQERSSVSVSLEPKIANVAKRFNAIANMTGRKVKFSINIKTYDFEGKEGERVHGWRAVLESIMPLPKTD